MYVPEHFRVTDSAVLREFIRYHSFGTLVSDSAGLCATHMPFLLDDNPAPLGKLRGHVARNNPQWRHFTPDPEVLAIFSGPHAYISPSWYESKLSVPTWDYAAVHAYGKPALVEDPIEAMDILQSYVRHYEASFEKPWSFDSGAEFFRKLASAVVCFEITITRLEGAFKLSQNRSAADRNSVINALKNNNSDDARAIAELIANPPG
jgi:transcriptional regulator